MANSVTARFNDGCKVFVSMSDDTTVEKAVIIDAEGNETDIGGGGGSVEKEYNIGINNTCGDIVIAVYSFLSKNQTYVYSKAIEDSTTSTGKYKTVTDSFIISFMPDDSTLFNVSINNENGEEVTSEDMMTQNIDGYKAVRVIGDCVISITPVS